jgi:hypothetical protein
MERGHVADNEMALQWIADRDRAGIESTGCRDR